MLKKFEKQPILYWTLELLALAMLILVVAQLKFIFDPIGKFVGAVFVPVIISGFLYYLLNPFVMTLQKIPLTKTQKLPRWLAITLVMIIAATVVALGGILLIPKLINQLVKLATAMPGLIHSGQNFIDQAANWDFVQKVSHQIDMNQFNTKLQHMAGNMVNGLADSMTNLLGMVTSITIVAVTVPVMTIYMLADGNKLVPFLKKLFPKNQQDNVEDIFGRLNFTISKYIVGQAIEMLFVAVFTTAGYFMIGQNYALLLGVAAGIANIIPYVGPYIGIVPALFVAFIQSPWQFVWVIIVVLIVQQIDGNLLYPRIIGATLNIHPMTIIIILLAAGNIAGIPGMILAIPMYAVVRTLAVYAWELLHLQDSVQGDEAA
ncbi:MAG: AI-2E family transporter [Lactobacillaceae bacterium]|jgi:predicted PurR-regulated permease PerM|nr:AI-2E family transporter [Lactobacillaceae bacterium]